MVTINLGNSAGSTANASYTLSDGCNDSIIDGMVSSVDWMTATASNGTITITATADNATTGERSGFIIPVINGESCTNNRFMVTQAAGEEPSTDCTCLVDNCAETGDLHEAELESSAGKTCDSALANNPDNYAFEVTYSQTSGGPWTTKSGDDNWLTPTIVARAGCIKGPTKQADYSYLENTTGSERWAKVHWTWSKDKEEGMCDYSDAYFVQEAGGGGGGGCEMSITISGLPSGEKAKVTWGSEGNEQLGNGTHSHTSTHSSLNVSVTKEGWSFNPSSASLSCGGTTSASFTGSEGCNGCDSSLVLTPSEITADPNGGTYTIEYTCCKELVLEGRYTDGMCTFTQTYNSSTQKGVVTVVCVGNDTQDSKTGYVLFKNDHASTECAKTKITQDKKGDIPESWIINLRIANTTSDYACIDSVEIFIDGFSTSLQTDLGECVNAGGEENLGSVTLPNAASAPEGSTITRIEAVVSDGTGTPGVIKTLTTNNSTLTNGGNYKFTYNG